MRTVIESVSEMQRFADAARSQGKRIGVVPTMGALHDGHLSLIRIAASSSDVVICSIFVNPTQFGPHEDLDSYPRSLSEDIEKASSAGATVFFTPTVREMYAKDYQTYVVNEEAATRFEGEIRPGHFRGVTTIVLKLFTATKPHAAVFGRKDAQQLAVIRMMVRDLGLDVEIIPAPIIREADGLAMSSRNVYLDADARPRAASLSRGLSRATTLLGDGVRSLARLVAEVRGAIEASDPTGIDYIAAVHPDTFQPLTELREDGTLLIVAVRFGSTRLLDNTLLTTR